MLRDELSFGSCQRTKEGGGSTVNVRPGSSQKEGKAKKPDGGVQVMGDAGLHVSHERKLGTKDTHF